MPDLARQRRNGQRIPADALAGIQAAFLAAFVEVANETGACRIAGVERPTVRRWEEHDATFSARYHDARAMVNDAIRYEIYRRGVAGYEKTLLSARGTTVTVTEYSDRLIEFLAKARMPEFREKQQLDVTSNGQTVGQLNLEQVAGLAVVVPQDLAAWRQERFAAGTADESDHD